MARRSERVKFDSMVVLKEAAQFVAMMQSSLKEAIDLQHRVLSRSRDRYVEALGYYFLAGKYTAEEEFDSKKKFSSAIRKAIRVLEIILDEIVEET